MKPLHHIALLIFICPMLAAHAQPTARQLTKKITDANAAANQVNQPQPKPSVPAPSAVTAPTPRAVTNVIPEKTQAQKAAILEKTILFQKKRAEAGAPTAQYDLGMRYLNGDGVEKNSDLAKKWLNSAATNGHAQATKKLAELNRK